MGLFDLLLLFWGLIVAVGWDQKGGVWRSGDGRGGRELEQTVRSASSCFCFMLLLHILFSGCLFFEIWFFVFVFVVIISGLICGPATDFSSQILMILKNKNEVALFFGPKLVLEPSWS